MLEGLSASAKAHFHRGRYVHELTSMPRWPAARRSNLVDEPAHSNAPKFLRHPKRWQDVEELLEAGIDVFATVERPKHLKASMTTVSVLLACRYAKPSPTP